MAATVSISAGIWHTCAIGASGQAYCWGRNDKGQLGDGTTTNRTTPTPVSELVAATSISAGWDYSCAVEATGQAYCWGANSYAQLGDGTTSNRVTPTPVSGMSAAAFVSTGAIHTCATEASGQAYCWGDNGDGRLGDGTTTNRTTATRVSGMPATAFISAGSTHTCAIDDASRAYCWGDNRDGELGDGTTTSRSTPTVIANLPPTTTLVSPDDGYTFEGTETQAFTIRASDPDGDEYRGEVEVYNAITDAKVTDFVTTLTASETDSNGTPVPPLEPGSYYWRARATDPAGSEAFGPWSGTRDLAVKGLVFECESTNAVIDGYVGETLLRVGVDQPSETQTEVCLRFDDGGASASGGRLMVAVSEGASTPTVSSDTSVCDDPGGEPGPQPLVSGEIGGSSNPATWIKYYADVRLADNETTVCVKTGNNGGDDNLLSRAITITVPDEDVVPKINFVPYTGGEPFPAPAPHPDTSQPSALCQTSTSGTSTQLLNLAIDGAHTWLYTLTDGDQAHACARVESGSTDGGGRLSMDTGGGIAPIADVQPGLSPHDPDSPCDTQIVHNSSPVLLDVHTSFPLGNPAPMCVAVASSNLTATVGAEGSPKLPTFEQDS